MTDVLEIDLPRATPELFLFTDAQLEGTELGRGKDFTAYDIGGGLVYRKGKPFVRFGNPMPIARYTEHFEREIAAYQDLPEDVFVSRTLMAWIDDQRKHNITEKAEGSPIFTALKPGKLYEISEIRESWEQAIAVAAEVPAEHYKKLIEDEAELRVRGILMDYTGLDNLLYEPTKGFTIIDAEFESSIPLRGKSMYRALVGGGLLHEILIGNSPTWEGRISVEARASTIEILERLALLGYQPKYQWGFKDLCEKLDYIPG